MDYRLLGRTGLRVSPLCLGTMNFGRRAEEAESHEIMDRGLELGINFFDTADGYGGDGRTEEIIGTWFAQGGGRREKVVLATKVYGGHDPWPNTSKLSARHIREACEASLRRLQTDHLDLYQMHHVDRDTPWEEIWQAMDLLVQQGKVLYVGSSNFAGWHIVKANEAARRRGSLGLVSEQSLYNLNARMVELERVRDQIEAMRPTLEAWEQLCAELGHPPADVALAWLLHNPAVTAPIIGPRTLEQLDGAMGALDVELGGDVLAGIDEIFPGPGGAAPEAYAW
jgi:aryl-alcohol dehydrogenase-like predicted oxidoreductase